MESTLKKIINYAVLVTEPEEIILFGSMVNGKSNEFSDVDLLIISENTVIKKETVAKIQNFSQELCLKTDILIFSKAEIEKESSMPNSFIDAIVRSGKSVYKKDEKNL